MLKSLLCLIICLPVINACAQTPRDVSKAIDSMVAPQFAGNKPGVSILVAQKGHIVYEKAYGSANMELNVPATTAMIFDFAANGKRKALIER